MVWLLVARITSAAQTWSTMGQAAAPPRALALRRRARPQAAVGLVQQVGELEVVLIMDLVYMDHQYMVLISHHQLIKHGINLEL